MGFGDYGGKGMKCMHGIELEVPCVYCESLGRFTENKPDDRVAAELASLTRSIQGLSGNVAKLVEDRPRNPMAGNYGPEDGERLAANLEANGFSKVAVSPLENFSVEGLIDELSRRGYVLPFSKHVKRGPVTDNDVKCSSEAYWNASFNKRRPLHEALEAFAKSRGLID